MLTTKPDAGKPAGRSGSARTNTASRTAIHEAGHAVIHRVLGMVCGEATVIPDDEEMTAGVAVVKDVWTIYSAWEERGKFRRHQYRSIMLGRIMGYMAGAEAEIIAFGSDHGGDGDDFLQIALMANAADVSEVSIERLRLKVRGLLRRHWSKVETVADALMARKTLSVDEIDRLVDRDGADVLAERIQAARQSIYDTMMGADSRRHRGVNDG
jgi:ATP-dependent Zn protease